MLGISMVLFLVLLSTTLPYYLSYQKYNKSEYFRQTGNSYMSLTKDKNKSTEYITSQVLERLKGHGKIVHDCSLPNGGGERMFTDLVFIHETGIYVFENSKQRGKIYGSELNKQWYQSNKRGDKFPFQNPLWLNASRIENLQNLLPHINPNYFDSLVLFHETSVLKQIFIVSHQTHVLKSNELYGFIRGLTQRRKNVFTPVDVDTIYEALKPFKEG